jgi:hypothetical protein
MLRVFSKPTEEKLERRCQGIQTFLQVGLSIQHLLILLRWRPKLTCSGSCRACWPSRDGRSTQMSAPSSILTGYVVVVVVARPACR